MIMLKPYQNAFCLFFGQQLCPLGVPSTSPQLSVKSSDYNQHIQQQESLHAYCNPHHLARRLGLIFRSSVCSIIKTEVNAQSS